MSYLVFTANTVLAPASTGDVWRSNAAPAVAVAVVVHNTENAAPVYNFTLQNVALLGNATSAIKWTSNTWSA